MAKGEDLTTKQKRFCEEYVVDNNATQAAIRVGYSEKTAGTISAENMKKPKIIAYIKELMVPIEKSTIASREEILEYLTSVVRGTEQEEVVAAGSIIAKKVKPGDRMKAAELLGKNYGMYIDKVEATVEIPQVILKPKED